MKGIAMVVAVLVAIQAAAAAEEAQLKLIDPKQLTTGHEVVPIFPAGHPALKALAGADKDEIWMTRDGRVQKVNNIHVPTLEIYAAPADRANGMSVILA